MDFAPIVFISAKTGRSTDRLMALIYQAAQQNKRRVTTGMLNDFLSDATARVQPPSDKGKRLKDLLHDAGIGMSADLYLFCKPFGFVPFFI